MGGSGKNNHAVSPACIAALLVFFFSSRRRHTRFDCDWSSDVCSSDLSSPVRWCIAASPSEWRCRSSPSAPSRCGARPRRRPRWSPCLHSPWRSRRGGSGERRVGEEGRSRGAPCHLKKKKQKHVVEATL